MKIIDKSLLAQATLVKPITCMIKIPEKIGSQRPIHIITRYPYQYPNCKTSNEIKPIHKHKGSVVIFDDMSGARNSSEIDDIFTKGRHEN